MDLVRVTGWGPRGELSAHFSVPEGLSEVIKVGFAMAQCEHRGFVPQEVTLLPRHGAPRLLWRKEQPHRRIRHAEMQGAEYTTGKEHFACVYKRARQPRL